MERREAGEQLDPFRRQVVLKTRMLRELLREHAGVFLRALRVLARLEITDAGQRQKRLHHESSRRGVLLNGLVRALTLDEQTDRGHCGKRGQETHGGVERREERAIR